MTKTETRYGFWHSEWTAEKAASASCDFAELRAGYGGLFWIRYDPTDARCTLWYWRDGCAECLTPAEFSLRSRVYEYGGGALCLTNDGIAFVNERDQQVYVQQLTDNAGAGRPTALTAKAGCRYGDLQFDPLRGAVVAVEESVADSAVEHRLVSVSLSGELKVLVEGADFYASPTLNASGDSLAWIQWQRPEQPWTATTLWRATYLPDGQLGRAECLAGASGEESLQQPRFATDGSLFCLSDRTGWWKPWLVQDGELRPLQDRFANKRFDHAPAPWQLGTSSYLPLANGALLLTRLVDGYGLLFQQDAEGNERQLACEYSRCRQLAADDQYFYCIAGSPSQAPAVLAIKRSAHEVKVLAGGERPLPDEELSNAQPFSFTTGREETAHAFFYPPANAQCCGRPEEKPPLVVFMHGGPTSASYPVFDSRIQYWTQRGFAVADINYRGSSGFGRAYRQRLRGEWGVVDVEDACAAVQSLAMRGQINHAYTFIRGSSAGGYSALCALATESGFSGGASLYGVSDPLALRRVTHKFEADYLDWLIGDPEVDAKRYRERTPLTNAARITVPVIFFQGGQDAVVLPEQTESMVTALQEQGVPVEYCLYPDERHGFRQAANLADALERECRFYQGLLG